MSFRSRSRTSQPIVRQRSLSSSRTPSSSVRSTNYLTNRPLSSSYSFNYGNNLYSSRENLNSSSRNLFYPSSSTANSNPYSNSSSSYVSPYQSKDRYISPYSTYDNGVTTAGLSLSGYSSYKNNSPYSNSSATNSSQQPLYKKDYTPRSSNLLASSRFSLSNSSLNQFASAASTSTSLNIGRSQSFKDYDRKTRKSRIDTITPSRSFSISSDKSEGYEVSIFVYHNLILFIHNNLFKYNFEIIIS